MKPLSSTSRFDSFSTFTTEVSTMPTYVYETVPQNEDEEPIQFEMVQRMTEAALTTHPETGQPVRRVISGGLKMPIASTKGDCCETSCDCD